MERSGGILKFNAQALAIPGAPSLAGPVVNATVDYLDVTGDRATKAQAYTLSSADLLTGLNELELVNHSTGNHWGVDQVAIV